MNIFNRFKHNLISQAIIIAVVFGFVSGLVGGMISDVYFEDWQDNYLNANLNNMNGFQEFSELKPVKKIIGLSQDFAVADAVQKIKPAIFGLYLKKPSSGNLINQVYLNKDFLGNGFILTSDGWLVTATKVISAYKLDQVVVIYENNIYPVNKVVSDKISGVSFIKIEKNNLPVATLGDSSAVNLGQIAVLTNYLGEVNVNNLKDNFYPNLTMNNLAINSEEYGKIISLKETLTSDFLGAPLLNMAGEVIGVTSEASQSQANAIPANYFRFVINEVLKTNTIKRPFLGVKYLDLVFAAGLNQKQNFGRSQGALIIEAPIKNSPAQKAGILVNDIIVSIDKQQVNRENNLAELIQQYQIGDEINFEILRDGKSVNLKVTLVAL